MFSPSPLTRDAATSSPPTTAPPIFIVGANRSGTTLLRLMLNAHSRIAVPEELLYFRSHFGDAPVESWRRPPLSEAEYAGLVQEFVENAATLHPEIDCGNVIQAILDASDRDLRHPYQTLLDVWTQRHGKARWGEKTPGNLFYVDVIAEMFPAASFVYVVRDPRAGVASMQKTDFFPEDVAFNAMTRRKHADVGPALLRKHVAPERWTTVRYEDLVREPEATLRRICEVIGEDYEPQMLQYHRSASDYMKEEAASTFNAAATRPVTASKIDAWQSRLSACEIAMIETVCAGEMREHGYAFMRPALSAGQRARIAVEYMAKRVYWHAQSWRHRHVRHHTVRHPILARFRRRLRSVLGSTGPVRIPSSSEMQ